MRVFARWIFSLALLAIGVLWLLSHIAPDKFGSCHHIALNIGSEASLRECQAYGMTNFVVPLAVVVVALLLLSSGDVEFTIPGLGTVKRAREKEAAKSAEALKRKTETLDERGEKFLQDLPTNPPPPDGEQQ